MLAAVVVVLVALLLSCYLLSISVLSSVMSCCPSWIATAHPPCKQMLAVVVVVLVATVMMLSIIHVVCHCLSYEVCCNDISNATTVEALRNAYLVDIPLQGSSGIPLLPVTWAHLHSLSIPVASQCICMGMGFECS